MQIIKDRAILEDTFTHLKDDDPITNGDITVSTARWQCERALLLAHTGKLGLRILAADNISELADDLQHFSLIELEFTDFADGRLFSHAWLLRERYRYAGEIRATGNYLTDQVYYLSRVGINAFATTQNRQLAKVLNNLNDFSVKYQSSIN